MKLRLFLTWTAGAFVLAVLLAAALPWALGDTSMVVRSGSMAPAIETGDVVVVEPVSPTEIEVGDIVTFEDPGGGDHLLVHRVRAAELVGSQVEVSTQGDANPVQEHWRVAADGTVGMVAYRVPMLGFAVNWINSAPGRIGLLIVPALLLAVSLLARIWRLPLGSRGPR